MPQVTAEKIYDYPRKESALVFLYTGDTRYSMNILLGALEKEKLHKQITVYIANIKKLFTHENTSSTDLTDLIELIRGISSRHNQVIIAMTLLTTQLPNTLEIINTLNDYKRRAKNTLLIAGGPHATGDPLGTLSLGFDVVFIGEGERAFTKFIEEYIINKSADLRSIPNISYIEGGKVVRTRFERLLSLDEYPPFPVEAGRFNPIEITRGCEFACRFCQVSFIFGARPIHRSIDNILQYVKILMDNNMRDVRFITPNGLGYGSADDKRPDLDKLSALLSSLHDLVIKGFNGRVFFGSFPSEIRPEFVNEETADLLKKYVSNRRIIIGAQTGSERLLKLINRGHTVEDILRAVELLISRGFRVDVDFIFGLPGETKEDTLETINLMDKIIALGGYIHAHYFIPLPGTPLGGCEPSPIDPLIIKFLNRYRGSGRVYGYFDKQIEISRRIRELIQRGVIRVFRCPLKLLEKSLEDNKRSVYQHN